MTTVLSGEQTVACLGDKTFDLIFLDMMMESGMDELDTYRKNLEIVPGQKAVIVSGFSDTARVKESQNLGAGEYIKKSYRIEMVGKVIKKEIL